MSVTDTRKGIVMTKQQLEMENRILKAMIFDIQQELESSKRYEDELALFRTIGSIMAIAYRFESSLEHAQIIAGVRRWLHE